MRPGHNVVDVHDENLTAAKSVHHFNIITKKRKRVMRVARTLSTPRPHGGLGDARLLVR